MFGLSVSKVLLLVAIAVAVWFLWRRFGSPRSQPTRQRARTRTANSPEAMQKCPRCGVYMIESAGRCEREDCPRPA